MISFINVQIRIMDSSLVAACSHIYHFSVASVGSSDRSVDAPDLQFLLEDCNPYTMLNEVV